MVPKLYMAHPSPPVRAVLLTAKALNVKLDLIEVNLLEMEHLKPEYIKLNPVHTIPTLDDNGFVLADSHAIMGYLVDKYGKDKSLYPADVKKRALINQILFFDTGVLFARNLRVALAILFGGLKKVTDTQIQELNEAYGFVEAFLEDRSFMAGSNLSIADFSIFTSLTNANVLVPLDEEKYPKIAAWKKTMQALPFSDVNQVGGDMFKALIESKLQE